MASSKENHSLIAQWRILRSPLFSYPFGMVSRPGPNAVQAREDPVLNPSPCSPGGGRRCSRPGAASAAGSSGLVVKEQSVRDTMPLAG